MSTIAYGLGQGFAQGADSVANAVATAERIKNSREQLRIANQYAQLAQDKWDITKQKSELEIEKLRGEIQNTQKQLARSEFGNSLFGALQTGNYSPVMYAIKNNQPLSTMFDSLGYSNLEGANAYSKDSILKFAGNDEKLAKLIEENPNAFAVVTLKNGDKKLIRGDMLAVETGSYKAYNDAQLQYLNGLQNNIAESMQLGAIEQKQKATDLSQYTYEDSIKTNALINPKEGQSLLTTALKGLNKESAYSKFLTSYQAGEFNIDEYTKAATSTEVARPQVKTQMFSAGTDYMASLGVKNAQQYQAVMDNPNIDKDTKAQLKRVYSSMIGFEPTNLKTVIKTMDDSLVKGVLSNMKDVVAQLKNYDPSDVAITDKLKNDLAKMFNISSSEAETLLKDQLFRSNFQTIYVVVRKELSGTQVTPQELEAFEQAMGSVKQSKTAMAAGLANLMNSALSVMNDARDYDTTAFDWYKGGTYEFVKGAAQAFKEMALGNKQQTQTTQPKSSAVVNSLQSQQPQPQQGSNAALFRQNILKAKGGQ